MKVIIYKTDEQRQMNTEKRIVTRGTNKQTEKEQEKRGKEEDMREITQQSEKNLGLIVF
jgi:hypothetical protein